MRKIWEVVGTEHGGKRATVRLAEGYDSKAEALEVARKLRQAWLEATAKDLMEDLDEG